MLKALDTFRYGANMSSSCQKWHQLFDIKVDVTADGQSVNLCWCQASILGPRPDFYYWQIVAVFFFYMGRAVWREDGSVVYIRC
jgi:hypothetical protein